MKRSVLGAVGVAAVLVALAGCRAAVQRAGSAPAAPGLQFDATFDTAADFYDRFEYGYSGPSPWDWGNGSGEGAITHFHGDHDMSCAAPTTARDVAFGGDRQRLDYSQLFWHCAPGGDASKGHLMTGLDTVSYNYAWFAPKQFFSNVSQVCWDINETAMSTRKWTEVMFVSQADAVRYPSNRGSGGFDLGFTNPNARDPNGPSTGILPQGGTLAGLEYSRGALSWFQSQDSWMTLGAGGPVSSGSDKATRFKICLENQPGNKIRVTQATPTGTRIVEMNGQIPQHPVKIVFQDNAYNASKGDNYNPEVLTWHWDNIQIYASGATEFARLPASPDAPAGAAPLGEQAADVAAAPLPTSAGTSSRISPGTSSGTRDGEAADASDAAAPSFNIVGLLLIVAGLVVAFLLGRRLGSRQVR